MPAYQRLGFRELGDDQLELSRSGGHVKARDGVARPRRGYRHIVRPPDPHPAGNCVSTLPGGAAPSPRVFDKPGAIHLPSPRGRGATNRGGPGLRTARLTPEANVPDPDRLLTLPGATANSLPRNRYDADRISRTGGCGRP